MTIMNDVCQVFHRIRPQYDFWIESDLLGEGLVSLHSSGRGALEFLQFLSTSHPFYCFYLMGDIS